MVKPVCFVYTKELLDDQYSLTSKKKQGLNESDFLFQVWIEPFVASKNVSGSNDISLFADKIALEGVVVQRADCRPAVNENYMKLKRYILVSC